MSPVRPPRGPGRPHNVPVTAALDAAATATPRSRRALRALSLLTLACFAVTVALDLRDPARRGPGVELAPGHGLDLRAPRRRAAPASPPSILLRDVPARASAGRWPGWALFWALDGLAQSYVRFGLVPTTRCPGMTFALWFLIRLRRVPAGHRGGAADDLPDRPLPRRALGPGRPGRLGVMCLAALAVVVAPAIGVRDVRRPARRRPRRGHAAPVRRRSPTGGLAVGVGLPLGGLRGRRWPPSWSGTAAPRGWSATGCGGCSGR